MPGHSAVRPTYLAVGANRQTAAADWSDNGTLCFGAGTNLAVWCPAAARGIHGLFRGHSDIIKAVRFLPGPGHRHRGRSACRYLITGGDDHALRVWRVRGDDGNDNDSTDTGANVAAVCVCTVEAAHAAPINCIAALAQPPLGGDGDDDGDDGNGGSPVPQLFATGGADAVIKIWTLAVDQDGTAVSVVPIQTIPTNPRFFPLCLALAPLDEAPSAYTSWWLLAAAGTSNRIQLFVGSPSTTAAAAGASRPVFALQTSLAGHEGWVRSLDFARERGNASNDLLLASASQDKYVRLWRVRRALSSNLSSNSATPASSSLPLPLPSNKAHLLRCGNDDDDAAAAAAAAAATTYAIAFEALLLGHEDWIYSARWDRGWCSDNAAETPGRLRLLTASADNSLAIWEADATSGIWVTTARLGELSKEKGATTATGSVGGFWTGLWAPGGASVATLCRTGSWRQWTAVRDNRDDDDDALRWVQAVGISGHVAPVTGVAWSRDGAYLLSTGSDQTTRLHAAWCRQNNESPPPPQTLDSWHEMARPQIHGYDINCIDSLGPRQFVSGADEKLMRVFHEPKTVARLLARLTRGGRSSTNAVDADADADADADTLPDAADMPVLGLSNKSVDVEGVDVAEAGTEAETMIRTDDVLDDHPPFEDTLSRGTLWPETEKLYGHGYEISCLAASHDGRLVASACRASSLRHAVVRLFETAPRWTELRPPLAAHALTVTRLRFSPDDRFLLSVGRDRQWAVFEVAAAAAGGDSQGRGQGPGQSQDGLAGGDGSGPVFRLRQANPKAHSRMLLDCAWAPARATGSPVFATAGRDKTVKFWQMAPVEAPASAPAPASVPASASAPAGTAEEPKAPAEDAFVLATTVPQDHPVTAIDFLARPSASGDLVLAVGTEGGKISIVSLDAVTLAATTVVALEAGLCLPKAVLQLAWRPPAEDADQGGHEPPQAGAADLAIAGDDGSLRVYRAPSV